MSFFEKKSRLLKFKSYRIETETGFKTDALKSAWFVGLRENYFCLQLSLVKCFAGIDEKTQQPPALGTMKYCTPILK